MNIIRHRGGVSAILAPFTNVTTYLLTYLLNDATTVVDSLNEVAFNDVHRPPVSPLKNVIHIASSASLDVTLLSVAIATSIAQ